MNKKHILKVSPLVGAVLLALSAPVAMAAVTAPAAGSLPGNFSTLNAPGTTYSAGSSNSATITVSGASTGVSAAVLQWGGTTLAGGTVGLVTSANNVPATNAGFDIGANASLTIATTGTAPSSLLINDQTGNPSQIYGTLNASSLGAPLFIANGNGVILGAGGTINV
ncbi:filamentous hemagglutinin N-terminal domain-containing protein, partial [Acidithiobacillus ferrivorans]|nr:filamentous hemagglutinin N-terminal domain-containing protein [Acidithiobacillus ferrivorans]